jgi:hypothetical protein
VFENQFDALPMMSALISLLHPLKFQYPITPLLKKPESIDENDDYNNSEMETFNVPIQAVMGVSADMY